MSKAPNIIYIFADQLSFHWTGFGGDGTVKTPHLDKLANDGLNFTHAYSTSPVCTPYRGILMTGRYPSQTGIEDNGRRIPDSEITLADCFNRAGYHTSYLGKWHIGGPKGLNEWVPPVLRGGFTDFTGWESHHINHWKGKIFSDENPEKAIELKGHETDGLTDLAVDKLDELSRLDKPFLFMLAYQAPHYPCAPPRDFEDLYEGVPFDLRANCDPEAEMAKPHWPVDRETGDFVDQCWRKPMTSRRFQELYFAEITQLDRAVGRLLDKINETGLYENTVVIFTSDHGEMAGSHGCFGKGVMLEESVRVPLLIRCPKNHRVKTGIKDTPVSTIDLMPTLLDAAGLDVPECCEGVSFAGNLIDELKNDRSVFFELNDWALIRNREKLIIDKKTKENKAFYCLDSDPFEQENLVNSQDKSILKKIDQFRREIMLWQESIKQRRGETEKASIPWYGGNNE
jgi:arylsulfatase A-like enzyme